ncbi:MAG TPA: hypothetical protein VIM96_04045 [Pseudomonadales bacterium]|jgi:hypothetical protein
MTPEQHRKKIHTLLVLLLFPFAMIAMAGAVYWMNLNGITLFGSQSRSKGELLVSPYPSLASLSTLTVLRGEEPIREAGERSWSFLQVLPTHCDESCQTQLWESRQTKVAMGRLSDRVRRIVMVLDGVPDDAFQALLDKEHPDISIWTVSSGDWQQLMGPDGAAVKLYFVDRFGNVMMRYRNEHTYKDIMKDMNFLIRHN